MGYVIRDVGQPQGPAFDPSQPPGIDNPPGAQTNLLMVPSAIVEAPIQVHNHFAAQLQINQAMIDLNFKAGAATYLEVADATTALRQAELGAVTEKLNAELAQLRIAKIAGTFEVQ